MERSKSSTVGMYLTRHKTKNTEITLYDCGGQIDYHGMHQIFLTRRALYLLVWDVQECKRFGAKTDEVIMTDDDSQQGTYVAQDTGRSFSY